MPRQGVPGECQWTDFHTIVAHCVCVCALPKTVFLPDALHSPLAPSLGLWLGFRFHIGAAHGQAISPVWNDLQSASLIYYYYVSFVCSHLLQTSPLVVYIGWRWPELTRLEQHHQQHIAFYLAATFSLQLARTCFYCSHHLSAGPCAQKKANVKQRQLQRWRAAAVTSTKSYFKWKWSLNTSA